MTHTFTVTLPDIGEGVVEGEVIEWLKQVGDAVDQDEPVVMVMTDKATVELPAPYPGKVSKHYFGVGETAFRDKPLYDIEVEGDIAPAAKDKIAQQAHAPAVQRSPELPAPAEDAHSAPCRPCGEKALATPPIRRLAKELGIDINTISGSGGGGRVTTQDIRKQVTAPSSAAPVTPPLKLDDDEIEPMVGIRRLTAQRMAESKQMAPHFSYFESVNAGRLIKLRSKLKQQAAEENIKLTYMPFLIKALSSTLDLFPSINASVDAERQQLLIHRHHHIGIAMASKNGLIVPILRDVQDMNIADVIREFDRLKKAALNSKLPSSEMVGSTITISNFGTLGNGTFATPIINYPEVAILAVNKISPQPAVKNGALIIQDTLNLSWSFDHRVIDGNAAAAVSAEFCDIIKNPSRLLF